MTPSGARQYRRGQKIQYRAWTELKKEGYHMMIGARSLGPFDIIAWRLDHVLFIQVKSCKAKKFYFKKKGELEQIIREDIPENCFKEVWIWIKNSGWRRWRYIPRDLLWELILNRTKLELPKFHKKPC